MARLLERKEISASLNYLTRPPSCLSLLSSPVVFSAFLVSPFFLAQENGWLLDGFPRTKAQADALEASGVGGGGGERGSHWQMPGGFSLCVRRYQG